MQSAFAVVNDFEQAVADYAGSRYAVAVDTCTSALFLCLKWHRADTVTVPARTYCSVPCAVIHAGGKVEFSHDAWNGDYRLAPLPIVDSAGRFRAGMYAPGEFRCCSFHWTKVLPLGRGGIILHDDAEADRWFRLARFSGRHACDQSDDPGFALCGWNVYMEPAYAARGLELIKNLPHDPPDIRSSASYPDLSRNPIYSTSNDEVRYALPPRSPTWNADGLQFRPVKIADASLIMRWRNTEQAFASFFSSTPVTFDSHTAFLRNKPPSDHVWIVEQVDRALIPVGMVSLTERADEVEYGRLVIDQEFRGQGLAERIEKQIIRYARKHYPDKRLTGEYLASNEAIASLHRKLGWSVLGFQQSVKGQIVKIEYLSEH